MDPVFVGIPARTPELEALLAEITDDVRAPRADGLHLTLRFLGNAVDAIAVKAALATVRFDAFELKLVGLGTFGRTPKVLYADVVPEPALMTLSDRVDVALDDVIGSRDRPLRPHVTVGRAQRDAGLLTKWRRACSERSLGVVRVGELVLYASRKVTTEQGGGPNRYEALLRVPARAPDAQERAQ